MIEVETPDGIIEFPADFSQDQINSALNKHFDTIPQTPAAPEAPRDIVGGTLPQGPPLPPQASPDLSTPQALAAWSLNQGISIPSKVAQLYNAGAGAQRQMLTEQAQQERDAALPTRLYGGEPALPEQTPEVLGQGIQLAREKASELGGSVGTTLSELYNQSPFLPGHIYPGQPAIDTGPLPITQIPGTNIRPIDYLLGKGTGEGIDVGGGKFLSGFTDPNQAWMLPFMATKPLQAYFAAESLAQVPESIKAIYQAKTAQERGEAGFGAAANLLMGGAIGRHLFAGEAPRSMAEIQFRANRVARQLSGVEQAISALEADPDVTGKSLVGTNPDGTPRYEADRIKDVQKLNQLEQLKNQREELKDKHASYIEEAAKIHGDLQPQSEQGAGQVPAQEGLGGVQPQTEGGVAEAGKVPLKLNDPDEILIPHETNLLQQIAGALGFKGEINVVPDMEGDPNHKTIAQAGFAQVDKAGNYTGPGKVDLNAAAFRQYVSALAPGRLHEAVGSVLSEEILHSFTTKAEAEAYGETLTPAEVAISQELYLGPNKPEAVPGGWTDARAGSEAARQRMQRMLGMSPTEIAEVAGRERWSKASLEFIARLIRRAREFFGTAAAKEGQGITVRILDRMEQNVDAASQAIGEESPFAVNRQPATGSEEEAAAMQAESDKAKAELITSRMASGALKPENMRVTINPPMKYGNATTKGFVQVDEVHPTEGNTFSTNPTLLRQLGFDIPPTEDFMKLGMGRMSLEEAKARIAGEGQAALNRTPARSTDFQEPPVPEGMTRLYRGFDGGPNKLPDYINKVTRPKEAFKRWFTPNRNYALSYAWKPMEGAYGEYFPEGAKLHYVDVPKGTDLGQFAVPDHAGEFILPKELSEQAADATRVTEQQAAIRRNKAKEEGQTEEVTPVNVTRAAYQHLDRSAQDVMVDPSAKQISYDRFAKDLKARFPGITSNALADTFEGSTWNMLMNASGEKLAALRESLNLRKSLGDRDVSNPPVRETGPPPVGKTGEERTRLRDIRKAQVAAQKYRANVISNIARKLFEGMDYNPTEVRSEVTPFDLWKPRNRQGILKPEPDQPVYNELTPEDRALPTDALGRMLTKDARASAKQKVSRTNRITVLQNLDSGKVDVVSTYRDPRRGAVLLDPQHPGQEHAPLESILKRYTPVASILLDRPVEKFRQSYDSLPDYEFKFGREARAAAHEPMAEAPETQGLPSAYQPTDPITRSEADAIIPHIENEVGTVDSPEAVKAALDALPERLAQRTKALKRGYKSGAIPEPEAEGAGTRQAVSAYLKITNKLQEQFPEATAQEILERLATKIYEIHNAAPAYEDFLRNIMAEGHPEVGQAAPNRPVTAPVPASEKGQAALRRKNEPGEDVAKAISEGPGAASPGDVPPAPPLTAPIASLPPGERPYQLVTPSSPTFAAVGQALLEGGSRMAGGLRAIIKGAAGDSMPKTTRANQAAGEAGVRYAASKGFARRGAAVFSAQTLQGTGVDPVSFGAALVEDNLRSVREGFRAEVTRLTAEGKPREAAAAQAQANAVTSLVGANHSPFADENAYQDFLADPDTRRAIEQHKQQWEEVVDPMYRDAQALDPDAPLPSRGQQTGARVNLKAILPGDEPVNMVGPKPRGPSLTATFKRKSPFARQAKGTGQAYEVNYNELIANTFERQLEIANKNAFDKSLVESGNAVIDKPGRQVMVGDERGVAFPLQRRVIAGTGQQPFSQAQNIYVRQSLATEYRIASDVDAPFKIPALTSMMNVLNKAALAGLTDFTVHFSNQMTALFNRPASAGLLADSLLSATGRADVPITLGRAVLKAMQNNEGQLAELAKIGALRDPFAKVNPLGRILGKTDEISRLLLDDTYKRLADAGLVEKSETARREYVNQIGQYNRRLQGPLTRFLRDTGFGPFVTAGKTFNALGVRMVTLSPGAKSTGAFAETALRGNVLSKWVGASVLLGSLNYLLTNKQKGGGMMGRPGVPIGSLDTGKDDKQGRPLSIPLLDILGLGRGLRVTGIKGYAQAKYLGLTNGTALDASARDIINSTLGPAAGPPVRFAGVTATGGPPAVNVPRTAPVAAPGQNQFVLNLQEALKDANPLIKSYVDWRNGKTVGEAVGQQVPRFAMQPGKAPALAAKYPQIVNAAQLRAYTDDLAKQLRSMPIKDRYQSTFKKFKADALSPQNRAQAFDQLERHGVFSYQ